MPTCKRRCWAGAALSSTAPPCCSVCNADVHVERLASALGIAQHPETWTLLLPALQQLRLLLHVGETAFRASALSE